MLKKILQFFLKNKTKIVKKSESIITDAKKKQIDTIWNNIDKMSGYGISVLCLTTQENDLAVALAHTHKKAVDIFDYLLRLNNKFHVIKLIEKYKTTTNEEDGYRMKSHIINTHTERFRKAKLI